MGRMIFAFLLRMLPAALAAVPAVAVLRFFGVRRLRQAGLAAITVVPQGWQWTGLSWDRINLIPFRVFRESFILRRATGSWGYFVINVVGNIVMFLPLGFFPCLLWGEGKSGLWRGTGCALLASLCVELCQLPQNRGTDVDDLWLNALGGALGFGLYWLVSRRWPGVAERFRVKKR